MATPTLWQRLIDAGLVTYERSPLYGPITLSGEYEAENGYWYFVRVDGGNRYLSPYGKAPELCRAERLLAAENIFDLPQEAAIFEAGLCRFFPSL